MEQRRPRGITVLGFMDLIVGLIGSAAFLIYCLCAFFFYLLRYALGIETFRPLRFILLTFSEAIYLALFFSGFWLLGLKREARLLFLYLSPLIGVVLSYCIYKGLLIAGLSDTLSIQASVFLTLSFLIVNIFYLNIPKVKQQLKETVSEKVWSFGIKVFGLTLLYFPIRGVERFPRHLSYPLSMTLSELYPNPPIHFLFVVISIIAITGIFMKRKWAYPFLIVFALFHVFWAIWGLAQAAVSYISTLDTHVFLNIKVPAIKLYYFIALIYFFTRPKVREQFK
jgi:hypothetical protein